MKLIRYADEPELRAIRHEVLSQKTFPEYLQNNDPWIRVHERIGGEVFAPAPESMVMDCPVSDWEEWTGMRFPEDGDYIVPEMLAPLYVRDGRGRHVEPNVWLRHRL